MGTIQDTIGRKRNKRRVKHWRCAGTKNSREPKSPDRWHEMSCRGSETPTENRSVFGKTLVGVLDHRSGVEKRRGGGLENPESGTGKH